MPSNLEAESLQLAHSLLDARAREPERFKNLLKHARAITPDRMSYNDEYVLAVALRRTQEFMAEFEAISARRP